MTGGQTPGWVPPAREPIEAMLDRWRAALIAGDPWQAHMIVAFWKADTRIVEAAQGEPR